MFSRKTKKAKGLYRDKPWLVKLVCLFNRKPIELLGWWQDDRIDDVYYTVAGIDVGSEDFRTVDVSTTVLNRNLNL